MLNEHIDDDELLYRFVPNVPSHWNRVRQAFSSSVFKDKNGVSVDREGGRTESEAADRLLKKGADGGIVRIGAGKCRGAETMPLYEPETDNPYHSVIVNPDGSRKLPRKKCQALLDACEILKQPSNL